MNVIAHSGDPVYAYDYEKVHPRVRGEHKLVEINNHSFQVRKQNIPNCKAIALCCKKARGAHRGGLDAHFETAVGEFSQALERCSRRSISPRS